MAALDDAQAFLGSFLSLTTKAELRYEGYMFYLNSQESTIGLRNVKSYGTEGRRMDGPQIPGVNHIFKYLYFRGSDIKSLDVLSSPDVNMAADLPEDPAIIRDHYPHPSNAFMNMVSATIVPQLPTPTFLGSLPLTQSVGSSQSGRSSAPHPTRNGYFGPSEQLPPLPKALLASPPGKPATVASQSMPFIAEGSRVFVSDEVLHKNLLELLELMKARISPPSPHPLQDGDTDVAESSNSGNAQEPEY